ncbi:DUF1761 domain-containing protein [Candidatus Saccharibacteria bacterium CPR2]|nr:DUF1761 domain-containing protein [Candidatus Saccharibacteria bacterium CPR2]
MDYASAFENINFLAILFAALSSFVVGGFWYSKSMFLKIWMKETGLTQKDIEKKQGMAQIFTATFLLALVAAYFLAVVLYMVSEPKANWLDGAVFGAVVGMAFVATSQATHVLFERKTLRLFAVQSGHDILRLAVMGAILGAFGS